MHLYMYNVYSLLISRFCIYPSYYISLARLFVSPNKRQQKGVFASEKANVQKTQMLSVSKAL